MSRNSEAANSNGSNCALIYHPHDYSITEKRIMGRRVAGWQFLRGMIRHGQSDTLYCQSESPQHFTEFCSMVSEESQLQKSSTWVPPDDPELLHKIGCLYRGDPGIGSLAWRRRWGDPRSYSLCGITYTLSSRQVFDSLGDLLVAPLQSWDAIVCISQSAVNCIRQVLDSYVDYLQRRMAARPHTPVQLPVIPLGVDCSAFDPPKDHKKRRKEIRAKWKCEKGEVVVLYAGRLNFHAKANPYPLFVALQEAQKATGAGVRLVLAGSFPNKEVSNSFRKSWQMLCPSVSVVLIDGRDEVNWKDMWQGADVFASLADNVQETFGLTPVEAMAAGLPVVISDWDGYRETVRHGVDGFCIPTITPPPGAGLELARRYAFEQDSYDRFVGHASLCTAVDIDACLEAFKQLISSAKLRRTMGTAGRQYARQTFDWKHIIPQYEQLWSELASRRAADGENVPRQVEESPHPLLDDPFSTFRDFPTSRLEDDVILTVGRKALMQQIPHCPIMNFGGKILLGPKTCDSILKKLGESPQAVGDLKKEFSSSSCNLPATLVWLLKCGVLRIVTDGTH